MRSKLIAATSISKARLIARSYRARIARLEQGGTQTFKLGPEAVAAKLALAAESRRPKSRYYVTIPTYAAVLFRRLLPTRALDVVMASN